MMDRYKRGDFSVYHFLLVACGSFCFCFFGFVSSNFFSRFVSGKFFIMYFNGMTDGKVNLKLVSIYIFKALNILAHKFILLKR